MASPARSKLVLLALAAVAVSACSTMRPVPRATSGNYFIAPVFQGDTLATFAERNGVQPNDILTANRVRQRKSTGRLINGQLRVPVIARSREQRVAPVAQAAGQATAQPTAIAQGRPATITPPAAAMRSRPASIETRSLAAPPATSARSASVKANGLDTQSSAPPDVVTASRSPQPSATEMPWYDWLTPSAPPAVEGDDGLHFLWPLEGRVISPFGDNAGGRNDGINISAVRGSPIRAAESGEVTYVGNELKSYGNLILIRHDNGFVTAYAHTDGVHVKRGERVERGQVIGSAGDTGGVSEVQLHFELRHGTRPIDPTPYLVAPAPPAAPTANSTERLAEGPR
jgi:murein DD-endopeptidase MepM/ murein hydrolase activator NlpD